MNHAIALFSFMLLAGSLALTIYNVVYAYRINSAGKKTGIVLPVIIKRLFAITVFLSFGTTAITLIIFAAGLFTLRLPL